MKNAILLALLMSTGLCASAQWVTIPDDNFANKLNELFPECMDGNQLDTTCTGIINATSLSVNNQFNPASEKIADLTGIQYFPNLETLSCQGNLLTSIPALPQMLTNLICFENNLTVLPELPSQLTSLTCWENNLTMLPELPSTLTNLNCPSNNLTVLPQLSASLVNLSCYGNSLTALPTLPQSLTELSCHSNNLTSLPQLPESLTNLKCGYNELQSLPELPGSLTNLECNENNLTEMPGLPQALLDLNCDANNLTTLPELPLALIYLRCGDNNLSTLPELPPSLTQLVCNGNTLNILPELPVALTYLYCRNNQLIVLPELPPALTVLDCRSNQLTSLPDLPPTLVSMPCVFNNLTTLPELPPLLTELACSYNNLNTLPELPASLTKLYCYSNNLTNLPELPQTLTQLHCQDNQITCLPLLPMSLDNYDLTQFNISNNQFVCLPNYVPAMSQGPNAQWLELPLCELSDVINNPYGCISFDVISGSVYPDDNINCIVDDTEVGLSNIPIQLLDEGSNLIASTYTVSNMSYSFLADTGSYFVKLLTENEAFQPSCEDPGAEQEVMLTEIQTSAAEVDFGIECVSGFEIGTQSIFQSGWVFPDQEHSLNISAGDLSAWYGLQCAQGVNGSVTVNITGPVDYVEPATNALVPNLSGDIQLIYEIDDFGDIDFGDSFGVILKTNTTAQAGDLVCVQVIVDPLEGDANPENNIYTHCYEVVNSYDPNIKQVWPQDVEPGYDGYFNYTIYFQNTGTAPAFNIRVADTLDTNLDLSTFQVTGYSHECLTYVESNVATFRFNNIMLPDSTSDFEGSIGYVQYRIKAVQDLPVGTIIENTAHIYFDFNEAIVTNTTQNEFVIDTGLDQPSQQLATVFPNPGTGQFNVLFSGAKTGITHLEVYNLSGQRVLQQQVNENRMVLDLTDYPSGMYLLHIRNERGSEAVKLLKH